MAHRDRASRFQQPDPEVTRERAGVLEHVLPAHPDAAQALEPACAVQATAAQLRAGEARARQVDLAQVAPREQQVLARELLQVAPGQSAVAQDDPTQAGSAERREVDPAVGEHDVVEAGVGQADPGQAGPADLDPAPGRLAQVGVREAAAGHRDVREVQQRYAGTGQVDRVETPARDPHTPGVDARPAVPTDVRGAEDLVVHRVGATRRAQGLREARGRRRTGGVVGGGGHRASFARRRTGPREGPERPPRGVVTRLGAPAAPRRGPGEDARGRSTRQNAAVMRTTRVLPLAMASVLALAATGCGTDFERDEPQTAVRDFLAETLATGNAQRACDYMTQRAQKLLAGTARTGETCRNALERAALRGDDDGYLVDTTGEVKDLEYSTEKTNEHEATVTVKTDGGPTLTVTLGHSEGLGNLYDPETPWRITGGVDALIQNTPTR